MTCFQFLKFTNFQTDSERYFYKGKDFQLLVHNTVDRAKFGVFESVFGLDQIWKNIRKLLGLRAASNFQKS